MNIHDLMTVVARSRKFHHFGGFNVAALTLDFGVASPQWKLGFLRMIEGPALLETLGRVTRGAIFSELALVLVIDSMATHTGRWHSFVLFVGVAAAARDARVLSGQRILSLRVIELRGSPPLLAMTVAAFLAELASMSIIGFVAAVAFMWRIAVQGSFVDRVAARACGCPMCAEQRVIGGIVVEAIGIQSQDVVVSTLVLRVTAPAGQPRGAANEAG
jgi:hypothetical protein